MHYIFSLAELLALKLAFISCKPLEKFFNPLSKTLTPTFSQPDMFHRLSSCDAMWKASLSKAIREVRFVLKPGVEHHGVWNFVNNKMPELRMLNPTTFFSLHEVSADMETDSAVHVVYGDVECTEDEIKTASLSAEALENILKEKVQLGLTLERGNYNEALPVDIVEARKYVKHMDDAF